MWQEGLKAPKINWCFSSRFKSGMDNTRWYFRASVLPKILAPVSLYADRTVSEIEDVFPVFLALFCIQLVVVLDAL